MEIISEGIRRRMKKVYEGIRRYTKVYEGIRRYTKVYEGIPSYTKVYEGTRRCTKVYEGTGLTRFITSRIVLVLELINDFCGITLHNWPARGINYSRAGLHYISRPVGELINNSITSLSF